MGRQLDEDDVRVRPPKGTRRRTRQRPTYNDAVPAVVVAVDRGRYTCQSDAREPGAGYVVAVRGADARRSSVVVGDRVRLDGDTSGEPDRLARIVEVLPRRSLLRRTPDDTDPVERPVVANAEQLVVVVALADPTPRPRMIDRCLVAAYDGGLQPVLCLTKRDLHSPDALVDAYGPLDVPLVILGRDDDLAPLASLLEGRTSVLFGHSGVGKSTLVNQLVPGADRATGIVNDVTGRGRHTSSSAVALALPGGGWVIDTPGVRSFGLGGVSAERVLSAFADLAAAVAADCPRDCSHRADAPDCALDADPLLPRPRVDSFRRLLVAREADDSPPG